jgi:23S rRNA (adenine2503-C2)-methyltransferase
MGKIDLKDLLLEELESILVSRGREKYRASQILPWIYQKGVSQLDEVTNLALSLRRELQDIVFVSQLIPEKVEVSQDGTAKFLFPLFDGNSIETVLIPERGHQTICISTQVGCPLQCRFCLSGKNGLVRNLKASEIVNQICAVKKHLGGNENNLNLVLMGIGEPLANYDNTLKALKIILSPWGLNFSHRKVTLSTAGLIPEMEQLGKELPVNLAVSLNASDDQTRNYLMPVNKMYPLGDLLKACSRYPLSPRKRITFEYNLIRGINDSAEDARKLTKLVKDIKCKVNLIPFNPHPGVALERPDSEAVLKFQEILHVHGVSALIRKSKGADIHAACGQLSYQKLKS